MLKAMKQTKYNKRYIARIVIEAATPLAVGTGEKSVLTDALVASDINGLPFIPGSSIAGVLRHSIGDDNDKDSIFGFQQGDKGHGSRIIFTDAVLLDADGTAQDGLLTGEKSDFLSRYKELPIRQHVCINEMGSTNDGGKFDEQVVYQGSRFVFEMEMVDDGNNEERYREVLNRIYSPYFRLGSGTRNGFGSMKVIDVQYRALDLTGANDLRLYIDKSSSLRDKWEGFEPYTPANDDGHHWHEYVLELTPLDFFLFSSGFGDDDADITPVTEGYIKWDGEQGQGRFIDQGVLIPATSFKGALSHRVAYHWNRIKEFTAENKKGLTGDKNPAVKALFGSSGKESDDICRGNVLFEDVIFEPGTSRAKLLNHVTIDRITGGTIDGHLFTEKVTVGQGTFEERLLVDSEVLKDETVKNALESALEDICDGLLPLGGGTNRGHGMFTGKIIKGKDDNGNQ